MTFSVFVIEALNNGKPKASITFEGPVAGNKDLIVPWKAKENSIINDKNDNEQDMLMPAGKRDKTAIGRDIRRGLVNDWPTYNGAHSPDGVIQRRFKVDWTHAGGSEDKEAARAKILEKNAEEFRSYGLEHKDNENAPPVPLHTTVQKWIAPYHETADIAVHGWYRLCVNSDFFPLIVEMEMRTAEQLKGVDPGTGHVYTYQVRDFLNEQKEMGFDDEDDGYIINEEGEASYTKKDGHKQAKDADFEESKHKLKYMHDLTSEIMKSQHQRMHRIRAHDADARRGAADLAWSGKFETLLYVIITAVQVYSVHKWLLGNLLGK